MPQRTNVFKEAGLGLRSDNAANPSLVIAVVNPGRREEASLAGSRPPSSHQSTCHQGLLFAFDVTHGYVLEDVVQYLWREGYGGRVW